ncbi:MAG TPA: glycosyl hydrolase family 8, partial [Magnetospirillum sp.]|nr:glycosyl hydrolase family 8 [Magnetospirillum sp.]
MRPRAVVAWMAAILSLGLVLSGCGTPPPRLDQHSWKAYSDRFVTADGRVIDRDSGTPGITHTEGLGYGMLLAEAAEDRRGFELIWRWTREHLRRPDGLFSWRYGPCPTRGGDCVLDKNNASDGDILIAWALLRAGKAWGRSDYVDAARAIAAAVADTQIVRVGGTTLLLPGSEGFVDGNAVVVNPSYWIFPAFSAFAQAFEAPVWSTLSDSSLALLRQSRFGRWNLPPDWLKVQGEQLS